MKKDIPAFPNTIDKISIGQGIQINEGMSLRDYFANSAMNAIISGGQGVIVKGIRGNMEHDVVAKASYLYADAMLLERSK